MLISKNIPNLAGGVSQQAPALRLINQCEKQENFNSSLVNGLCSRAPVKTEHECIKEEAFFVKADRDSELPYNLLLSPNRITVYDKNGITTEPELSQAAREYLEIPSGVSPQTSYKTLTLADYTFVLNRHVTAKLTGDTSDKWVNQALVFVKSVNTATTWSLVIGDVTHSVGYGGANVSTGAPDLYVGGVKTKENVSMSTTEVAAYLYKKADTAVFPDYDIKQSGAVLWIRRNDGGNFIIGFSDTRADTYANLITSRIQKFADLPTVAPDGYICRVLGDTASTADDYFVKFKANTEGTFTRGVWVEMNNGKTVQANTEGTFTRGVWVETVSPGIATKIDAATMPWILEHTADAWTFKPFEWAERAAGEEETNPVPSFIGRTLNNIFLYRNRLCFLSADTLCMSAAAEHARWWNETAFTFSDSDPIYISASTDEVTELHDFGTMQESLILFGENGQFILQTPDTLSPKTAALLPLASETYSINTGIITIGANIYFGHKSRQSFNIKELGVSSVTGQKEANAITAHVPGYIPFGDLIQLKGSASCDTIAVRTSGAPDALFIYQYYITGGSRVQAAWSKYIIADAEIKGMFFRESVLWLYLWMNGHSLIATLNMEDVPVDEAVNYCLDFQTELTAEFEATVWPLPLYLRSANAVALYKEANGEVTANPITAYGEGYASITLKYPTTKVTVGLKYSSLYVFSTPFMTNGQQGAKQNITSGRWQLQRVILQHGLSGDFEVLVQPTYDDSAEGYKYSYAGRTSGMQTAILGIKPMAEGEFKVPLRGKNTDLRVIIQSDSWLPRSFISADWEGNYITKARAI